MAMQMQRAFNAKFLTLIQHYSVAAGSYDDDNNWVEGGNVLKNVYGVIKAGNKFSQFEEGEAIHNEQGGIRTSLYRSLYVKDKYRLSIGDKVGIKGVYYNILQTSDESVYGFHSYLIEKSKTWRPS
jgi:hypothetical protein